ncbi:hypothetical protein DAPPUDRAFT_237893 [Daphnia pulex]|uniref:Uncharacterized protein n=1 Tax=Daphnia pulex TaxID=6669 RepID=E9G4P7_DAPPU|nr:hypothetical protein DAPPUDRAFT_237893 [Daphnia pulex]|eukprot:EFX85522.1 hypothetical protein DAPPUDRAFT_237893 [Daphnia pulex]
MLSSPRSWTEEDRRRTEEDPCRRHRHPPLQDSRSQGSSPMDLRWAEEDRRHTEEDCRRRHYKIVPTTPEDDLLMVRFSLTHI